MSWMHGASIPSRAAIGPVRAKAIAIVRREFPCANAGMASHSFHGPVIVEEARPGAVSTWKEHAPIKRPEDAAVRKNEAILMPSRPCWDRELGRGYFDRIV